MGLFSTHQVIGVDFGHASVKVVGLELAHQPKVVGFAEVPVDPKYLQKEGFEDHALIGEALKEAMRSATPRPLKPFAAYAAVSERLVFRKILELPVLSGSEEYLQVIRTEASEFLPDSIDTVELDYQILGPGSSENLQEVMVVAVGKRVIQDYTAVFSTAKVALRGIDPKPSAVGRAVVGLPENDPIALIDVGSETSSLSIYDHHTIWVTGTVNMGGGLFKDAETGKLDEEKLPTHLKQLSTSLLDELDHVLKFYANRTSGQTAIKEVRLSGGGSMLVPGLVEALQAELDQKVVLSKAVIPIPDGLDRRFYGALGSALYPLYELL